jgi:hypothetical protein
MKAGRPRVETLTLHIIAFHPVHETQVTGHGKDRGEDVAGTKRNAISIVRVPLSGAGGIGGTKIRWRLILELPFVGVSSVKPRVVAKVMVNSAAELVRVVCAKARSRPIPR